MYTLYLIKCPVSVFMPQLWACARHITALIIFFPLFLCCQSNTTVDCAGWIALQHRKCVCLNAVSAAKKKQQKKTFNDRSEPQASFPHTFASLLSFTSVLTDNMFCCHVLVFMSFFLLLPAARSPFGMVHMNVSAQAMRLLPLRKSSRGSPEATLLLLCTYSHTHKEDFNLQFNAGNYIGQVKTN